MKQIPVSLLTLVAGILVTLVSLWVGQNHGLLPVQASAQAPLVDGFFNVMVTIATGLFLVVEGAILIFAIKFRRRPGDDTDGEPIEGNFSLEAFWTAIPAIVVIGLGIYSVEVYTKMGGMQPVGHMMAHAHSPSHIASMPGSAIAAPLIAESVAAQSQTPAPAPTASKIGIGATPEEIGKPADVVVNVTGMQYAWVFNYGDTGVTAGELHVPVGKDVQLNISSNDVIHSFWVPQFRLKQDAIPGVPTELRFTATKTGEYPVVCAELCGGYHGGMRSQVIVQTQEEFDSWLEENLVAQQQDPNRAVAVNPADLPTSEFLAPYAKEMGINSQTLADLQPHH